MKNNYQYIGRIKTNFDQIDKLINKLQKIKKIESAVEKSGIKNKKVTAKINSYLKWGYNNKNTQFYRAFSRDHKKIFEKFIKVTKLDMAVSSIIKQYPGHTIPWHKDNYFDFAKSIENKDFKIDKKKNSQVHDIFKRLGFWSFFFSRLNNYK